MKYKVAKTAGFCGGVQKAFLMVKKEFEGNLEKYSRVLIFGSLVHNDNVMKVVSEMGIKKIDSLEGIRKGDVVIITAHGVSKKIFEEIEAKGAQVFDATCPKVTMVQECAQDYFKKGFQIVIFGDKEHKEVKGINGWCENSAHIVADFKQLDEFISKIKNGSVKGPILLISQTTQNIANFEKAKAILVEAVKEEGVTIEVVDTICRTTFVRQKEAFEIAREMEMVIVIGGRSSSNTKQLWKIVSNENKNTIWIEDPSELQDRRVVEMLKETESVGIVSGASTSLDDIEKVKSILEDYK